MNRLLYLTELSRWCSIRCERLGIRIAMISSSAPDRHSEPIPQNLRALASNSVIAPGPSLRPQKNPGSVRQPGSLFAGRQRSRTYQRINSPTGYITPSRRFDVSSTTPGTCASLGATRSVNAWQGRALDMTTCLQFWYLMGRGIV